MAMFVQGSKLVPSDKLQETHIFQDIREELLDGKEGLYIGNLLQRACQRFPGYTALLDEQRVLSYKELYFRSLLLSEHLIAQGVKPGDRVFIYAENSCEFFIAYFAILQIGAVAVPINIFLHTKELAYIVQDAQPRVIFVTSQLKSAIDALVEHGVSLPDLVTEVDVDWERIMPDNIDEYASRILFKDSSLDDLALLLYTSGTTGVPKGVMLSSRTIIANLEQTSARFTQCGLGKKERIFCVLPLFHAFAQHTCMWLPIAMGSSVILVQKIDRKLILDGLKNKPTVFFGFPALFGLLCIMKTAPLETIKLFVSGADMLPDKIRAAFAMVYGRKICSGYGLTEAAPVVAVNHHNDEYPTNVVGRPLVGIDCSIRNEQGVPVTQGEVGLLWIKGANVMMGYYNAAKATDDILKDGWLNTGDLARIDAAGNLAIEGRIKDVIIHKGFNIYPAEVENVLLKYPSVIKAAVVGLSEPAAGQVPVAFVAVRRIEKGLEEKLRKLCAHNLAAYKVPRKIVCLDDLPLNATGKVDKKKLTQVQL